MLFVSPRIHGEFYRALVRDVSRATHMDGARVAVVRKRRPIYFSTEQLNVFIANYVGADNVPPLLRRGGNGSLIERTFGYSPSFPRIEIHPVSITWEATQPHRVECGSWGLPLPPKPGRDVSSWQMTVATYCFAELVASDLGFPPCLVYFFFRDWLVDQVKIARINKILQGHAARLLQWACGGASDPDLDLCTYGTPRAPPAYTGIIACRFLTGEVTKSHPDMGIYEIHQTGNGRKGFPTNWMQMCATEAFTILKFARTQVQPIDLWRSVRALSTRSQAHSNIIFDTSHVYLYITQDLLREFCCVNIPAVITGYSKHMRLAHSCKTVPRVAPFLVLAYAHYSPAIVAHMFLELLFDHPKGELGQIGRAHV